MTISYEMKEIMQIIIIDFNEDYDEAEVIDWIDSFYYEWLNYEETADEEMWDEIENMSVERWITEHLSDYEYDYESYEVKNIK